LGEFGYVYEGDASAACEEGEAAVPALELLVLDEGGGDAFGQEIVGDGLGFGFCENGLGVAFGLGFDGVGLAGGLGDVLLGFDFGLLEHVFLLLGGLLGLDFLV
jgi:hypothetical protein